MKLQVSPFFGNIADNFNQTDMTIILWILLILFVIIPAITFAPEGGTPPFFILIAKLTVDQSGKKKEKKYISLCTELVVYTAYYCGSEKLDEETISKLKEITSSGLFLSKKEKAKKSEKITEEINEYFKIASQKVIDKSDIMLLCDEIVKINWKYILLEEALFSAVFQTGEFNPILREICDKLGYELWRFNKLYESYTQTHKKRNTNTSPKKSYFNKITPKEETKNESDKRDNSDDDFLLYCTKLIETTPKEETKRESDKRDDNDDDFLLCCTKLIVYTAKFCGCNSIDVITRIKIREFIKKNDPANLSTRLEELDKLIILASNTDVSILDLFILCKKIRKELYLSSNTLLKSRNQEKLIDILFSAVYLKGNHTNILKDISENIGNKYWFEDKRKEYEKKYSKNTETSNEKNKEGKNNNKNKDQNSLFVTLTLELLVEAMKVDRSKMVCEFDVIKAFILKYDKENFQKRVSEVKKHLNYAYIEVNVEGTCTKINKQFRQNDQIREEILKILIDLIYADDTCTNVELNLLKKVAERLKISKSTFDFLRRKYEKKKNKDKQESKDSQPKYTSELEKAYAALGISQDATDKELSATWRNLMRVNHPDLMESKGDEAIKKATAKCQEINKAFEIIKASRGMR
ncbi:MAG: TerB family tellurite resistance protein [Paludibacteraceae bacterium]|nr:TerB family tellurite resistance protein [Paludibacteraceae bacterium]